MFRYETNIIGFVGQDKLEAVTLNNHSKYGIKSWWVVCRNWLNSTNRIIQNLGGEVDEFGYIKVKPDMSTIISNVYAAGDSTNASNNFHQIVTAFKWRCSGWCYL